MKTTVYIMIKKTLISIMRQIKNFIDNDKETIKHLQIINDICYNTYMW